MEKFFLKIKGKIIRCLIGKNNYEGLCYVMDSYLDDTLYSVYKSQDREGQVRAKEDYDWHYKLLYIFKEEDVLKHKKRILNYIENLFGKTK